MLLVFSQELLWKNIKFLLIIFQMQKQKKNWSQYEDNALKTLKDSRKIQKWSQIAKLLEEKMESAADKGYHLDDFRYHNHLSSDVKKEDWNEEQENILIKLHNQKGNRWAQIAKVLNRSDNAVKNHYHSKLRKGIRRINYRINVYFRYQHKSLKNNIISKIVQTAEQIYFTDEEDQKIYGKSCFQMKNKILQQANDFENLTSQQVSNLKRLVVEINTFNRTFKKKSKKNEKPIRQSENLNHNFAKNSQQNMESQSQEQISQKSESHSEDIQNCLKQQKKGQLEQKIQNFRSKCQKNVRHNFEQQISKKYKLRTKRCKQIKQNENVGQKIGQFSRNDQINENWNKIQCKTPQSFDLGLNENLMNLNSCGSMGFINQNPMFVQYFNIPIYQPIISSFNVFPNIQNSEYYRNSCFQYLKLFMVPSNDLISSNQRISSEQNAKNLSIRACDNIILKKGFVDFNQNIVTQQQL